MATNVEKFIFFDNSSTSSNSNIFFNSVDGTEMTVQVSGLQGAATCNLKFQGKADNDAGFVDLAIIDMSTLKLDSKITTNGMYTISTMGISQIRGVCSSGLGTIKAYGISIH